MSAASACGFPPPRKSVVFFFSFFLRSAVLNALQAWSRRDSLEATDEVPADRLLLLLVAMLRRRGYGFRRRQQLFLLVIRQLR